MSAHDALALKNIRARTLESIINTSHFVPNSTVSVLEDEQLFYSRLDPALHHPLRMAGIGMLCFNVIIVYSVYKWGKPAEARRRLERTSLSVINENLDDMLLNGRLEAQKNNDAIVISTLFVEEVECQPGTLCP